LNYEDVYRCRKLKIEEIRELAYILAYQMRRLGVEDAFNLLRKFNPIGCFSKITNNLRLILSDDREPIATIRASNGAIIPKLRLAFEIKALIPYPQMRVVVVNEMSSEVKGSVFARHVIFVDPEIRAGDEVLVVDENDTLIGVGRALLNSDEMMQFIRGVAVKLREMVNREGVQSSP